MCQVDAIVKRGGLTKSISADTIERPFCHRFVKLAEPIVSYLKMPHRTHLFHPRLELDGVALCGHRAARLEADTKDYRTFFWRSAGWPPTPPPGPAAEVSVSGHSTHPSAVRCSTMLDTILGTKWGTNARKILDQLLASAAKRRNSGT